MKQKLNIGFSLALILSMLFATGVLADQTSIDNDLIAPGKQSSVNLNAFAGETVTTSAQMIVEYQGSKHLVAGSTVVIAGSSTTLPTGYSAGNITLEVSDPWTDGGQLVGTSAISFTAPSAGVYTYTVGYNPTTYTCGSNPCLTGGSTFTINLEVTAAPAELDAVCNIIGWSGIYTGTAHGATGTCTYNDTVLTGLDLGDSFTNVPGGTAHWTFAQTGYKSQSGDVSITISKAPLTVTADDQTIIFGQDLPTFTFQYDGFVNGEDASVIDEAPTCGVGEILMYGEYPITCSGGVDNNYYFTPVDGTLTVLPWTLTGFYQPVDMDGVWNTVKGGSTVPFKFEVFAGETELTDTAVVASFTSTEVPCTLATGILDAIEITTTGGTSLRYDPIAGQFINNWKTPKQPGVCYVVTMTTKDGSTLDANFILK